MVLVYMFVSLCCWNDSSFSFKGKILADSDASSADLFLWEYIDCDTDLPDN
jgi:hypothetical protein